MPVLSNPKHERFAQELAKGISASKAYESAGFKASRFNAATLARKQHIVERVSEVLSTREEQHGQATAKAIEATALTKEWIISRLIENANRAMQAESVKDADGQPIGEYKYEGNVANKALELLGKELGMFIDRAEVDVNARYAISDAVTTPEQWEEEHATAH